MTSHQSLLALLSLAWSTHLATAADSPQTIAFRLTDWKSLHFDTVTEAKQQLQTLKQLGCEARMESHVSHADLKFRAPQWTKVTVDSDDLAHEWEKWLKTAGFETLHGHDEAPAEGAVAVHYRLPRSQTLHPKNEKQTQEFLAIYSGLGCVVRQNQHAGHMDVSVTCPSWRNLVFTSHEEAHRVQKWLKDQGFETQHQH